MSFVVVRDAVRFGPSHATYLFSRSAYLVMNLLMEYIVASQQKSHGEMEAWFGGILLIIALVLGWSSFMSSEPPFDSWIWLVFIIGIISIIVIIDGIRRVMMANKDIGNLRTIEFNERSRQA